MQRELLEEFQKKATELQGVNKKISSRSCDVTKEEAIDKKNTETIEKDKVYSLSKARIEYINSHTRTKKIDNTFKVSYGWATFGLMVAIFVFIFVMMVKTAGVFLSVSRDSIKAGSKVIDVNFIFILNSLLLQAFILIRLVMKGIFPSSGLKEIDFGFFKESSVDKD